MTNYARMYRFGITPWESSRCSRCLCNRLAYALHGILVRGIERRHRSELATVCQPASGIFRRWLRLTEIFIIGAGS